MQQQPRLPLWFLVVNWGLILTAFVLGTYLGRRGSGAYPEPQKAALRIVHQKVLDAHLDPPTSAELIERAIGGMVRGLDEYSRYIPPREVPEYDERSSGAYEGIGAKIVTHVDDVVVHFPFPGGPAAKAGLLPGDRLVAVDETELADADTRDRVVELVRGPAKSTVRLRIDRDGNELTVDVPRGNVQRPCVKWTQFADEQAGLGYLHLTDFHPTSARQIFDAIAKLEAQQPLNGLILDLRHDGGGNLEQCLDIARAFLREGVIATQIRRDEADQEVYRATPADCRWPDLPLVILVNESSASASEVLTGALQDHKRAVVVGRRTYGKGHVNTVYSWHDYDFKLKLTTGTYTTPNGRSIQRDHSGKKIPKDQDTGGIFPDVDVELPDDQRRPVFETLQYTIEVPDEYRDGYAKVAERYGFEVARGPTIETDAQYAAAVDALRKLADGK